MSSVGQPTIEYYDNNGNYMNIGKKYIENAIPDLDSEIKSVKKRKQFAFRSIMSIVV